MRTQASMFWIAMTLVGGELLPQHASAQVPSAGNVLWLRSDAGVHVAGGLVSQWDDQSGSGNNAVQTVATQQPSLVSAELNGHPVLRFDGADDVLGLTGETAMQQFTLFIVEKLSGGATGNDYYPVVLGGDGNITGHYYGIEARNSVSADSPDSADMFAGFGNDARAHYPSIAAFDTWRIVSTSTDQLIANTIVHMNGADARVETTGANVSMSVQLGNATGTGFGGVGGLGNLDGVAKCDVAEVLVYDRVLTVAERLQVETYLSTRYGIPLVACAPLIADDFASSSLSPRWVQIGNCGPAVEGNGQLILSKPAGCGSQATRGVIGVHSDPTSEVICGDFDISVDYTLTNLSVPATPDSRYTGLLLKLASDSVVVGHVAAEERYLSPTDVCTPYSNAYKLFGTNPDNCVAVWTATSDFSGRFRMVRQRGTIYQYYWDGGAWIQGRTAPITQDALAIELYTAATTPDAQEVRYDNLVARSGTFALPGEVSTSLKVGKAVSPATDLIISWSSACSPGGTDYGIYEGTIGGWYSHTAIACSDAGADLGEQIRPANGNDYYLVVPHNLLDEGGYGMSSNGTQRPTGTSQCVAGQIVSCP